VANRSFPRVLQEKRMFSTPISTAFSTGSVDPDVALLRCSTYLNTTV
jgi:hypothetical protein